MICVHGGIETCSRPECQSATVQPVTQARVRELAAEVERLTAELAESRALNASLHSDECRRNLDARVAEAGEALEAKFAAEAERDAWKGVVYMADAEKHPVRAHLAVRAAIEAIGEKGERGNPIAEARAERDAEVASLRASVERLAAALAYVEWEVLPEGAGEQTCIERMGRRDDALPTRGHHEDCGVSAALAAWKDAR